MRDRILKDRIIADLQAIGFDVTHARPRVDGADVWISRPQSASPRRFRLRLKAVQTYDGWLMNAPRAEETADDLYYLFIDVGDTSNIYRIVPSAVVSAYVSHRHAEWLNRPGRYGQAHNDSQLRKFNDPEGRYVDAWTLIENS